MRARIRAHLILSTLILSSLPAARGAVRPVPREHPRILGDRARLERLAKERPEAYARMARVAREADAGDHEKVLSMALLAAIDGDRALARKAVEIAMRYARGPVKVGHVPFAHDLAIGAFAFDLAHEAWTEEERSTFCAYMDETVDRNRDSETHVFHNGWYGYKQWGIGIACYATYHENPRAPAILAALKEEYRTRAAPALRLAGAGGGWAEGYYIHYFLYEWLFFCEVARLCEGWDAYAEAPEFYRSRAVASMFEMYPPIGIYGSRRPIPMGDGGGRVFGGDRDKALAARRILVGVFRDDPEHRAVHAFDEATPRSSVGNYAYKDFLWRDPTIPKGDLAAFRLSHISPGPGYVYARSSWMEDATYFFFKCGDRFTSHQHLDVGHFLIFRHEELAGDGGHYDGFGSDHDVNVHLRTIAHSTILIEDPRETWPSIRAGRVTSNDGGQHHRWPHHNGAVADPDEWKASERLYDIADLIAFEDRGAYLHVAGDATRAYAPEKIERFTREILFIRPGTFVIFDRVASKDPSYRKTWLLQTMEPPSGEPPLLVVTNGGGRLFVQTLLPAPAEVRVVSGPELYRIGGRTYPPSRDTGPAPKSTIEVSPARPAAEDLFLHVLTATDASVGSVPGASAEIGADRIAVRIGEARVAFENEGPGGEISIGGGPPMHFGRKRP